MQCMDRMNWPESLLRPSPSRLSPSSEVGPSPDPRNRFFVFLAEEASRERPDLCRRRPPKAPGLLPVEVSPDLRRRMTSVAWTSCSVWTLDRCRIERLRTPTAGLPRRNLAPSPMPPRLVEAPSRLPLRKPRFAKKQPSWPCRPTIRQSPGPDTVQQCRGRLPVRSV